MLLNAIAVLKGITNQLNIIIGLKVGNTIFAKGFHTIKRFTIFHLKFGHFTISLRSGSIKAISNLQFNVINLTTKQLSAKIYYFTDFLLFVDFFTFFLLEAPLEGASS